MHSELCSWWPATMMSAFNVARVSPSGRGSVLLISVVKKLGPRARSIKIVNAALCL